MMEEVTTKSPKRKWWVEKRDTPFLGREKGWCGNFRQKKKGELKN